MVLQLKTGPLSGRKLWVPLCIIADSTLHDNETFGDLVGRLYGGVCTDDA